MKRIRPALLALVMILAVVSTVGIRGAQHAEAVAPYYDHTGREGSIVRLYSAYFLRGPDVRGFNYWLMQSIAGWDLRQISDFFASSDEFVQRYGSLTTPSFVSLVYWNVLGRSTDPGGTSYWQGRLNSGLSRGEMMAYFSDSAEYRQRTITSLAPGWRAGTNAKAMLAELKVAKEKRDGFDPALFPHWDDEDDDGCDTRCEVLAAEKRGDGTWYSLWDRQDLRSPGAVHIDHVVSLAEAWDSGAHRWTKTQRDWFADDQVNLTGVSASVAAAKGDGDAGDWVPPSVGARCAYAEIVVTTKFTWNLSVDTAEKSVLEDLLNGCTEASTMIPLEAA